MVIKMENKKDKKVNFWTVIGNTMKHILLFCFLSVPLNCLSFLDIVDTGKLDGKGLLPLNVYEVNPFWFYTFFIAFNILFLYFWNKYLKKDFWEFFNIKNTFGIIFLLLYILFLFLENVVISIAQLFFFGLFKTINLPYFINIILFIIFILYPIISLIWDGKKSNS